MSDVPNRSRIEATLAREIAKISAPALRKLLAALGDPPSLNNVPDSFWRDYEAELRAVLSDALQAIYADQAQTMAREASLTASVNWNQVNQVAADWAQGYSFELVKGIEQTTQAALQTIISKGIEQTLPLSEIRMSIEQVAGQLFGPDRAAVIATTELTRAAAEGEAATVAQLADAGVNMTGIWMTREDEIVCDVCGALDGKRQTGGMFEADGEFYDMPPAHPNCRCSIGWEMAQ